MSTPTDPKPESPPFTLVLHVPASTRVLDLMTIAMELESTIHAETGTLYLKDTKGHVIELHIKAHKPDGSPA